MQEIYDVDKIHDILSRSGVVSVSKHKNGKVTEIDIYMQNVDGVEAEINSGDLSLALPKGTISFKKKASGVEINSGGVSINLENFELWGFSMKGREAEVQIRSKNT